MTAGGRSFPPMPSAQNPAVSSSSGPLAGMRIIDLSSVLMGPFATQMLADYGADVVKVESPEGDLMRLGGAMRHPKMGALFLQANRNKRSVVLDLKTAAGQRASRALIARADAVLHNQPPARAERWGLDRESVRAINPRAAWCMVSALGINTGLIYGSVFAVGCLLAGLAGGLAAPVRSLTAGMGFSILIESFIVTVIGGMGSIAGALVGALILGLIRSFCALGFPLFTDGLMYLFMAVVLIIKPTGLFGREVA